jgi:hypothetical protein
VLTALGAVVGGVYTGKNSREADAAKARLAFESFKLEREKAEELAAKSRIEAIADDAAQARKRLREQEAEYDQMLHEARQHGQRGWDLARYHFGLLATVAHLMNNIFSVDTMGGPAETLQTVVRNSMRRMESIKLPMSLEEPLSDVVERRKN